MQSHLEIIGWKKFWGQPKWMRPSKAKSNFGVWGIFWIQLLPNWTSMYCLLNYQLYGWLVNLDFEVHCHRREILYSRTFCSWNEIAGQGLKKCQLNSLQVNKRRNRIALSYFCQWHFVVMKYEFYNYPPPAVILCHMWKWQFQVKRKQSNNANT